METSGTTESHPAWVCGLKQTNTTSNILPLKVTPCVGVWIETTRIRILGKILFVTPCVGVWIETTRIRILGKILFVTPCVGVWIETESSPNSSGFTSVTPCVGVWIETNLIPTNVSNFVSHPAWVCGLKHIANSYTSSLHCHTLRGCVD